MVTDDSYCVILQRPNLIQHWNICFFISNYSIASMLILKVPPQCVSFQIHFANNQTYLVSIGNILARLCNL